MIRRCFWLILTLFLPCWVYAGQTAHEDSAEDIQLGTKDMVTKAGVCSVVVPKRNRMVQISTAGRLTEPHTEYVLVDDIVAEGTGFIVEASNITLNLNGHVVKYLTTDANTAAYGISIPGYHKQDIAIVNGSIVQGDGKCKGSQHGIGCNPIYDYDSSSIEIGGVEINYKTPDTSGIHLHWTKSSHIHHNTITDRGDKVSNRHQGISAIEASRGGKSSTHVIHHNLIEGARQIGIRAGARSEVHDNEIHIESVVTNSTGIAVVGGLIHNNKIWGRGVHPIGLWPGNDTKVYSNYVVVQNTKSGSEYGDTGAACLRMTWGNDNVEVMYNTLILHAEKDYNGSGIMSWGRCVWVGLPEREQKAYFHDNVIIANNKNGKAKAAAIAVVCNNKSPNLVFRNNKVISNWCNVLLSDSYGHSDGYPQFIGNIFEKEGNFESYHTIRCGYWTNPSTAIFTDNLFEEGASLDDVAFDGSGKREILVKDYLEMSVKEETGNPVPQAQVVISDLSGMTVFDGKTDSKGMITADLTCYIHKPQGKDIRVPYSFMVTKKGFAPKTGEVAAIQNITMKVVVARVPR